MIVNWVNRFVQNFLYLEALRPQERFEEKQWINQKQIVKFKKTEERIVDTGAEYVKELEDDFWVED